MSEYLQLKQIFEMAEVLEDFTDDTLTISSVNQDDTKVIKTTFSFNQDKELTEVISYA